MRRLFRATSYAFLGMFVLFFIGIMVMMGFPDQSLISNLGLGLATAVICTSPLVFLTFVVSGIGSLFQRNALPKMKNDMLAMAQDNPERLDDIMQQLSPSDRAYLQRMLDTKRLGISDDGELMSLDELLEAEQDEDEGYNSLYLG